MLSNNSFITQSQDDVSVEDKDGNTKIDDTVNYEEEDDDVDQYEISETSDLYHLSANQSNLLLSEDLFSSTTKISSPPLSPVNPPATASLSRKSSHTTNHVNAHRLIKQLITKHEEKVTMIYSMNKTELNELLQKSFEEIQSFYEEKLVQQQKEYQSFQSQSQQMLTQKDQEINNLQMKLFEQQQKYIQLHEKLITKQYQQVITYKSPYSVYQLFLNWKQATKRNKQIEQKEAIIERLQKQYLQEKYFLLMISQYELNKKNLVIQDLQFKYDTISSEMVMKYENELQQSKQELQDAYTVIRQEERKRTLLEDELRKMLLKNMTSINVEALSIFQHINHSTLEDIIIPNSAQKSTATQFSDHNNSANLEDSLISANSDQSNNYQPAPVPIPVPPPVNHNYWRQTAPVAQNNIHQSSHDSPSDRSLSPKPVPFNIAPSSKGTTVTFKGTPIEGKTYFAGHVANTMNSFTEQRSSNLGATQLLNMNINTAPSKDDNNNQAFVNRLSEMYRKSVSSTSKFAKVPSQPVNSATIGSTQDKSSNNNSNYSHRPLSQEKPESSSSRRSTSAPRYQNPVSKIGGGSLATNVGSNNNNINNNAAVPVTGQLNSAQKAQKSSFGQSSNRFKY